jgi:hypothetical protein
VKSKNFSDFSEIEANEMVSSLDSGNNQLNEIQEFYSVVKNYVIQYYTGTKEYMTTYLQYNIIPKPYQGCIPVK